jgi:CRP-like cAMP-binding protein
MLLQLRQNVVCNGRHAVEHRLARWLLETADRLEAEMIPVTQEHVSQRLGVRRTTVTLLASKFQDIGAIRWGRSRIEIVDRPRLGTMACSCYRALHDRTQALLALGPTAPGS